VVAQTPEQTMHRRHVFLTLALSIALRPAQAQVRDLNDAINKAGRQRMLSQRMAKSYMALGQGVRRDLAERVLADSMALFDRQQVELQAYATTSELKSTYQQLEGVWSGYKAALVGTAPTRAGAEKVLAQAEQVLQLAHQGTQQFEGLSNRPAGKLVNVSGRQRMLIQRMASMYLGASWGVQADSNVRTMDVARAEFVQALGLLKGAPESGAPIQAELELAAQQFTFFDAALRGLRSGSKVSAQAQTDVFTASERILQVMDSITGLYVRLA
jgi:hypothetical protein